MSEPETATSRFQSWVDHFVRNTDRQVAMELDIDWSAPCELDEPVRRAFVTSFQRFELGEDGDGATLLAKARAAGDAVYSEALSRLVVEEQRHSALFRRGLEHLGGPRLSAHWSDSAFTFLRRMLGLRTELGLFLVAESVAMGYFTALREAAPTPVLRGIGRRVESDEADHLRFQTDRLRHGFAATSAPVRLLVGLAWGVVAAGAATVLCLGHAGALRACGRHPARYWVAAMGCYVSWARRALGRGEVFLGPLAASQ